LDLSVTCFACDSIAFDQPTKCTTTTNAAATSSDAADGVIKRKAGVAFAFKQTGTVKDPVDTLKIRNVFH
jgi:hypothetical protein